VPGKRQNKNEKKKEVTHHIMEHRSPKGAPIWTSDSLPQKGLLTLILMSKGVGPFKGRPRKSRVIKPTVEVAFFVYRGGGGTVMERGGKGSMGGGGMVLLGKFVRVVHLGGGGEKGKTVMKEGLVAWCRPSGGCVVLVEEGSV